MRWHKPQKRSSIVIPYVRDGNAIVVQQMGDVEFYSNGALLLGTRIFFYGTPIDNYTFSEGFIARRRIDQPNYLSIESPDGDESRYYYDSRMFFKLWTELIPVGDVGSYALEQDLQQELKQHRQATLEARLGTSGAATWLYCRAWGEFAVRYVVPAILIVAYIYFHPYIEKWLDSK